MGVVDFEWIVPLEDVGEVSDDIGEHFVEEEMVGM